MGLEQGAGVRGRGFVTRAARNVVLGDEEGRPVGHDTRGMLISRSAGLSMKGGVSLLVSVSENEVCLKMGFLRCQFSVRHKRSSLPRLRIETTHSWVCRWGASLLFSTTIERFLQG